MKQDIQLTARPGILDLGWKVDDQWRASYWSGNKREVGGHSPADLVQVPAALAARHGVIIAQSGSGKSYFLGRLIEELLLKTKARVVVIDPNADFRAVHQLKIASTLEQDQNFPTEHRDVYMDDWIRIKKLVFCIDANLGPDVSQKFELWWPNINVDVIAQGLSPIERAEFAHCHQFVRLISEIAVQSEGAGKSSQLLDALVDRAEELFIKAKQSADGPDENFFESAIDNFLDLLQLRSKGRHFNQLQQAMSPLKYVSMHTGLYYFSRTRQFQQAGILSNRPHAEDFVQRRLTVLDLPSIPDLEIRQLAVSSTLNLVWRVARTEWESALAATPAADSRIPTFIVVDEAHNLIPSEPRSASAAAVREQFRTIAAEGRKYGVFLLAATQRPDRLDPLILSEFENITVMRISSAQVMESVKTQLGISNAEAGMLGLSATLGMGQGILLGRWTDYKPVPFLTAARRSVEGGRSLRADHWTTPYV